MKGELHQEGEMFTEKTDGVLVQLRLQRGLGLRRFLCCPQGEPIIAQHALTGTQQAHRGEMTGNRLVSSHFYLCESHGGIKDRSCFGWKNTVVSGVSVDFFWCFRTPGGAASFQGTGSPAGSDCWPSAPLQRCSSLHSSSSARILSAPWASPEQQTGSE